MKGTLMTSQTRGATEVPKDKYAIVGSLLSDIGGDLARIVGGSADGSFLYAEGGQGWMASGVFKEVGGSVLYMIHPGSSETSFLSCGMPKSPRSAGR